MTEERAIEIAKKYHLQHEVNYEMVINGLTPEEALIECSISYDKWN